MSYLCLCILYCWISASKSWVTLWRGPDQDVPFDIILWYIAKKSCFLGIGPIRDVELTCIFRLVSSLCTLNPRYVSVLYHNFLMHIFFQMLLSWHWIMFCTLFWWKIWNNVHFESLYLFTLNQHTAKSNSTVQQHYRHII